MPVSGELPISLAMHGRFRCQWEMDSMNDLPSGAGSHRPPVTSSKETASPDAVLVQITAKDLMKVVGWARHLMGWLTAGYVTAFCCVVLLLERWGERSGPIAVLLYAPPQVLLVPLFVLTPACLLLRWRLVGWHLAAL